MSVERAAAHLKTFELDQRIQTHELSTATVALAAKAFGCEEKEIAKTLSFLIDGAAVLIVVAGDSRIDNSKFKRTFHTKAKMIPFEDCERLVGHAPGGVCPFGVNEGVKVYLDESLKVPAKVVPAAGSPQNGIVLSLEELEKCSDYVGWVDVTKSPLAQTER